MNYYTSLDNDSLLGGGKPSDNLAIKKSYLKYGISVLIGAVAFAGCYQNYVNNNYYFDGQNYFQIDTANQVGPFFIRHSTSNKYIHPSGGSTNPGDNTQIIIHSGYHSAC